MREVPAMGEILMPAMDIYDDVVADQISLDVRGDNCPAPLFQNQHL